MIQPKVAKRIRSKGLNHLPENERMPHKKNDSFKNNSLPTIILGGLLIFWGSIPIHKRRWVKYFSSSQQIEGSKTHILEHTQDLLYSLVEINHIFLGGRNGYILILGVFLSLFLWAKALYLLLFVQFCLYVNLDTIIAEKERPIGDDAWIFGSDMFVKR